MKKKMFLLKHNIKYNYILVEIIYMFTLLKLVISSNPHFSNGNRNIFF